MMRLVARIMLYFAMFSYRENNEGAGHAVGSARNPIEQGVSRMIFTAQEVPVSIPISKPPDFRKDKSTFYHQH